MTDGWKQAKQLHVILPDGETAGPHSAEEIEEMLEEEIIQTDSFAFCEGMPDWRSVPEALVWSRRGLAQVISSAIAEQMKLLLNAQVNDATARAALRKELQQVRVHPSDAEVRAIEAILHTNTDLRRRYENFNKDNDPEVLEAYPACELFECADLLFPRDWKSAWEKAGGKILDGRMVARVDDPAWSKLSDFGYPFAPFSFERWMETEILSRDQAVRLNLVADNEQVCAPALRERFSMVGMSD